MDGVTENPAVHITKVEDVIEILKADDTNESKQVLFDLPPHTPSTGSTTAIIVKSHDSGLSHKIKKKKKLKKNSLKRHKSHIPEALTWPSDSDITVLKMKLCLKEGGIKENLSSVLPGDGVHHDGDSSSMVNLAVATLLQRSSKHSVLEEYLMPLSSWEEGEKECELKNEKEECIENLCVSRCEELVRNKDSGSSLTCRKSKMAHFLRLYFCPCCSCLYDMEKMHETTSPYTGHDHDDPRSIN